jgi:hypothetical protein
MGSASFQTCAGCPTEANAKTHALQRTFLILPFSVSFSGTCQLGSWHPNDGQKLMDAEPVDLMT